MTMFGVTPRMNGSKFFAQPGRRRAKEPLAMAERAVRCGVAICPACLSPHPHVGATRWSMTPRCVACGAKLELPEPVDAPAGAGPASSAQTVNAPPPAPRIMIREIARAVSLVHGIPLTELMSERRQRATVVARQEAMWLAKKYTHHSLPSIGRGLGGRDHATVIHGIRSHQARIDAARAKRRGG